MEQKLKILGLGINRFLWWKLTRIIRKTIGIKFIEIEFAHISLKEAQKQLSNTYPLLKPIPDIVFTSFSVFEDMSGLENFLAEYSRISTECSTCVVLIENPREEFLKTFLSVHPLAVFNFSEHSGLTLADPVYFAKPESNPALPKRIETPLKLNLSTGTDIYLDSENKVSFYLLEEVESVLWDGATYEVEDFLTLQTDLLSAKDWIEAVSGFLQVNGDTYLSDGFQLRKLINLEANGKPIDHLLSESQINRRTQDFSSFLFKLKELVKYRINLSVSRKVSSDSVNVKANIPVTVCSENPVVNRIFYLLLKNNGYKQVITVEDQIDLDNRFLLNPTTKPEKNSPLCFNLPLEPKIFAIPGFSKITNDIYASTGPVKEWADIAEIQAERNRMAKQMQRLDDQVRSLSSSKIMADQEKYINLLATKKQEILSALLEISDVWDEAKEAPLVRSNEELLIIYDDQLQATTLNNLLPGRGKKLYVDVLQQISDLKALIALNTEYLEPFLHKGIVICCSSSKSILTRKLHQFRNELSKYQSPDLSDAIGKLNSEKKRCQKRLLGLAFEEVYFELMKYYDKMSNKIYEAAKTASLEIERSLLRPDRLHRICICSLDKERCELIEFAVNKCLSDADSKQFQYVMGHPGLKTTLNDEELSNSQWGLNERESRLRLKEKLIKDNAQKVNVFFQNLLEQFNGLSADLLVIEQDLLLLDLFIPILRQEKSAFQHTPIVGIFSGEIDMEIMNTLAHQGVKLMYRDQFRSMNKDFLVEPLQMILTPGKSHDDLIGLPNQAE